MFRASFRPLLRSIVSLGLVLSLLTFPTFSEEAKAANPDCVPTISQVDLYVRNYVFTSTTLCDFVAPAGVSQVTIYLLGGGGGGGGGSWSGTHGGGGGGGGAGAPSSFTLGVTSGNRYPIQVGAGGSGGSGASAQGGTTGGNGGNGGASSFNGLYSTPGGTGGTGGSGDTGGAGGSNGGIVSGSRLYTASAFASRSGGAQNNGNGGGGQTLISSDAVNATSTLPGAGGRSVYAGVQGASALFAGAGGSNNSSSANPNEGIRGGTSTLAPNAGPTNTGSGGSGGHGCASSSSTCANSDGAAGTSGLVYLQFNINFTITQSGVSAATSFGKVGVIFSDVTISMKGATGSVTYTAPGGLPSGLSLNSSTGVISGTPTAAQSTTIYDITGTDSIGSVTTKVGIGISQGPQAAITFSAKDLTYNVPTLLTASGGSGSGAITFSTTSSDCQLSGTRGETVTALKTSGSCIITATKAADSNYYLASQSTSFTMVKVASTVSIAVSPASPREAGNSMTITATVGSGQTGTVTFSAGGSPITSCGTSGAVSISGTTAVCVWTPNSSGSPYTLAASYSGDGIYQSANASTLSYTIYPSITLSYPGISTSFGTAKTSTPTISGGTGSTSAWTWSVVKASDSSLVSGITISSSGVVSVSSALSTGTYAMRVTATDTVGVTKSANLNVVVGLSNAASPTVTSAESTMTAGGVVHLTASVLSAATGTMAFKYGSTTISGCGAVSISSGLATCDWTTSTSTGSPFSITAVYSGDGSYSTATSPAISVAVVSPGSFSYTSQSKVFGEGAVVTPSISGGVGTFSSWSVVNASDSQAVVGITINQSGVVTLASSLGVGTYSLRITANDANSVAGSGTLSVTVSQGTTTMSLSAKTIDGRTLTGGTLGRQVRLVVAFNIPVMGSVTISDARGTICTTFASNNSAECWWAPSDATYSPYALTASFAGNSNGTAATSNTLTNFTWNAAMSVSHPNTSVETGKTVTISPTTSGGTGAVSTWSWGISQFFTGSSIGGITINSSGVIRVAGSVAPGTYTMVVSSGDLAGSYFYNNVTITVSDILAPDISLSLTTETATVGSAITGFTISNLGSAVDLYSIDQSLPAGLTFSSSTGVISGTPTETATALVITLSASNVGGIDTATYVLTIVASGGSGGGATISISLAGGAVTAAKGTPILITATVSMAGRVKFLANGKVIGGCASKNASTSATCSWTPAVQGQSVALSAILNPTSGSYSTVKSSNLNIGVVRRTGRR